RHRIDHERRAVGLVGAGDGGATTGAAGKLGTARGAPVVVGGGRRGAGVVEAGAAAGGTERAPADGQGRARVRHQGVVGRQGIPAVVVEHAVRERGGRVRIGE